ncbi:MAG: PIG-L family deacetylase [Corticimicrobacter sp.]|uniref:PIG-L family deacetylase n=1 Tax=Corticimicrobacter sp. TaxID=2678536 RepID=UPI0032DAC940
MIPTSARRSLVNTLIWLCGTWLHGAAFAAETPPADCHGIRDLVVVAHMDDDLLFMNPDIDATLAAGGCVRTLYMTASERNDGAPYMRSRESGVRAAYARMAGAPDNWSMQLETVAGRPFASFTLESDPRIQLWHMRLTDPWLGKGWGSLTPLSQAESIPGQSVATLALPPSTYTRQGLVDTLAQLIREYAPTVIRHMDDSVAIPYARLCWRCSGHDHPDHISSARLTREATLLAPGPYARIGYVNYPTQERQANLSDSETARKTDIFRRYAWQDNRYCPAGPDCNSPAGPTAAWVARIYYVTPPDGTASLLPGTAGSLQLLGTNQYDNTPHVWQSATGQWQSLGGRPIAHPMSVRYPDNSTGILALDAQGQLWGNDSDSTHAWHGWQRLAGFAQSHPPAMSQEGTPALVALDHQGQIRWTETRERSHRWREAATLPPLAHIRTEMALVRDQSGRLAVFAQDRAGALFVLHQTAPNSLEWQPWQRLDTPASNGGLAALRNAQGAIELYFRDQASQHLLRLTLTLDDQKQVTDLGVAYRGSPAVALDMHNTSTIAVRGTDQDALWVISAGVAHRLGEKLASSPALLRQQDGLHLAARLADTRQGYRIWVQRPQGWKRLDTVPAPSESRGTPFATNVERRQVFQTLK